MTELQVRIAEYVGFALMFGWIAADLALGFWEDYGWPWRRKPGTNGRWRTDGLLVLLFGSLSAAGLFAAVAAALDGWSGARHATTALFGIIVLCAGAVRLSGKAEQRVRREIDNKAAARTERAAERAEQASEDTRRSARLAEVANAAVIARMGAANEANRVEAAAQEERAEAREERSEAREERGVALEERALERNVQAVERASSVAEAASEDTRRSAVRTETAAEKVIESVDGGNGSAEAERADGAGA